MLPRRIAGRYAVALFALAEEQGKSEAWGNELQALGQLINASPDLHAVLKHPEIPLSKKETIVSRAFQGRMTREILAVLMLLIRRGHEPDMTALAEVFMEKWHAARRTLPVSVTSAVPLSPEQRAALVEVLARRTGSTILLHSQIDASLIAGMVLTIGDRVIDASAHTALHTLQASMAGV